MVGHCVYVSVLGSGLSSIRFKDKGLVSKV